MKTLTSIAAYLPGFVLPAAASLVSASLFTRILGSVAYGQFSYLLSLAMTLKVILYGWLQQSAARYLPGTEGESLQAQQQMLRKSLWVVAAAILGLSVVVLAYWVLADAARVSPYVAVGLVGMSAGTADVLQSVLRSRFQVQAVSIYRAIRSFGTMAFRILLVLTIGRVAGSMLYGMVVANLLLVPFMWKTAGLATSRIQSEEAGVVGRYLSYGLPMSGWMAMATVLSVGDRVVLSVLLGDSPVGIYSANYGLLSSAVFLITTPVNFVFHPRLMKLGDVSNDVEYAKVVRSILVAGSFVGSLVVLCVTLFAPLVALLLGSEFRSGAVLYPWIMCGLVYNLLGNYTHSFQERARKTGRILLVSVFVAALNVLLNVLGVPYWGQVAAALSTLVAYLIYYVSFLIMGRHLLSTNWMELAGTALLPVVVGGIAIVANNLLSGLPGFGAVVGKVILVAVYVGASWPPLKRVGLLQVLDGASYGTNEE